MDASNPPPHHQQPDGPAGSRTIICVAARPHLACCMCDATSTVASTPSAINHQKAPRAAGPVAAICICMQRSGGRARIGRGARGGALTGRGALVGRGAHEAAIHHELTSGNASKHHGENTTFLCGTLPNTPRAQWTKVFKCKTGILRSNSNQFVR